RPGVESQLLRTRVHTRRLSNETICEILPRNTGRTSFSVQRFNHVLTSSQRAAGQRAEGRRTEGRCADERRSAAADQRPAPRKKFAHTGAEKDQLATPLCDERAPRREDDFGRRSQYVAFGNVDG